MRTHKLLIIFILLAMFALFACSLDSDIIVDGDMPVVDGDDTDGDLPVVDGDDTDGDIPVVDGDDTDGDIPVVDGDDTDGEECRIINVDGPCGFHFEPGDGRWCEYDEDFKYYRVIEYYTFWHNGDPCDGEGTCCTGARCLSMEIDICNNGKTCIESGDGTWARCKKAKNESAPNLKIHNKTDGDMDSTDFIDTDLTETESAETELAETTGTNCKLLKTYKEIGCSETPREECQNYSYDTQGNLLSEHLDEYCDQEQNKYCVTYTYNEDQSIATMRTNYTCEQANDNASRCHFYTCDENSNVVIEKIHGRCGLDDEVCMYYTYNNNENMLSSYKKRFCSGEESNDCVYWTYDTDENLLTKKTDYNCDGETYSGCDSYTYGENKNMLTARYSNKCNRKSNRMCRAYTYDTVGKITSREVYINCYSDYRWCFSYAYDADDNMVTLQTNESCSGKLSCRYSTYDDMGNMLSEKTNFGCNPEGTNNKYCISWTYDNDGKMLTEQYDKECDGTPDYCISWTYNTNGNLIRKMHDYSCGDEPLAPHCTTWTYQCFD